MAEEEQKHAHRLTRFNGWTERLGIVSGVIVAAGILATVAYCAANGHPSVAQWLGGSFFASVVAVFVAGKLLNRQGR